MTSISRQVDQAVTAIQSRWSAIPRAGIILGTGLGELADQVRADAVIDYDDIPGFAKSTALAHRGRLVCGELAGAPVIAMQGRVHLYEGYSPEQIALPVRVMRALGAEVLIVTNANGGMNPKFKTGDVVVMDDHVNLMFANSDGGCFGIPRASIRDPHMPIYDERLIHAALAVARREDFAAHRGVYIAVTGPSYETRAEYRMLRKLGDCVGMSTVPEAITAAETGMRVLGLSIVTNVAKPDAQEVVDAEEVLHDAALAGVNVQKIILDVLRRISQ